MDDQLLMPLKATEMCYTVPTMQLHSVTKILLSCPARRLPGELTGLLFSHLALTFSASPPSSPYGFLLTRLRLQFIGLGRVF